MQVPPTWAAPRRMRTFMPRTHVAAVLGRRSPRLARQQGAAPGRRLTAAGWASPVRPPVSGRGVPRRLHLRDATDQRRAGMLTALIFGLGMLLGGVAVLV